MNCRVRFGNCFLRAPLMYQPCCLVPGCQGKLGELRKKQLTKPQKQFILSLGIGRKLNLGDFSQRTQNVRFLRRHGGQRFVRNFAILPGRGRRGQRERGDKALAPRGGKFSVTGKREKGWTGECIASAKINLGLSFSLSLFPYCVESRTRRLLHSE